MKDTIAVLSTKTPFTKNVKFITEVEGRFGGAGSHPEGNVTVVGLVTVPVFWVLVLR